MSGRLACGVLLLCSASLASARPKSDFARHQRVKLSVVQDVYGFDFSHNGTMVDRVIVGKRRTKGGPMGGVVLVACAKKKCWSRPLTLGRAKRVHTAKIVDLAGRPASLRGFLRERASASYRRLPLRKMRWPALVLTTHFDRPGVAAKHPRPGGGRLVARVEEWLYLISLRRKDFDHPLLFRKQQKNRGSYGHGLRARFRLVAGSRGAGKGRVLQIEESRFLHPGNGSGCPAPKATIYRHVLKKKRFREVSRKAPVRSRCY